MEISTLYQAIYSIIGTMYGGDSNNQGLFFVPNYSGMFFRGSGSQTLDLQVPSNPKSYVSPPLGVYVSDKSVQPSNYVTSINQNVKSFLERGNSNIIGISFTSSNAVSSLQYNTANESGIVETFPVHTSINYYIKY